MYGRVVGGRWKLPSLFTAYHRKTCVCVWLTEIFWKPGTWHSAATNADKVDATGENPRFSQHLSGIVSTRRPQKRLTFPPNYAILAVFPKCQVV